MPLTSESADKMKREEVEATVTAAKELETVTWAAPLLRRTRDIITRLSEGLADHDSYLRNPLIDSDKAILIEVRFARALHRSGANAIYEYETGVGDSSIDFKIEGTPSWMIEVMSLRESNAVRDASWQDGPFSGMLLSTDAEDPKQSEEGEMIRAQERISEKVYDHHRNAPKKFPPPNGNLSMILVDARGFLGDQGVLGDQFDWHHIALGAAGLHSRNVRTWINQKTGRREPIQGLFESENTRPASVILQERIHFLGFVCEKSFADDELVASIRYYANPQLFRSLSAKKEALASFPLSAQ